MANIFKNLTIKKKEDLDNYVDKQLNEIEKGNDKQLHSSLFRGHKGVWRDFARLLLRSRLPWLLIIISIAVSLISTKVGSLFPAYQQRLFSGEHDSTTIRNAILILVCSFIIGRINSFLTGYTNSSVSLAVRNKLYSHTIGLPLKVFQKISPRELISRVTQDADSLASTLTTILLILISSVYGTYLYISQAFVMSPELTKIFLYLCPVYIILKLVIGRINFNLQFRARYRFAFLTRYMASILMNVPVVKTFSKEKFEDKRGEQAISSFTKLQFALEAAGISFDLIDQIFDTVNNLIYILYGAYLIRNGSLDFGSWLGFYFYSLSLYSSILVILNLWPMLKSSQGSILRIQEIIKVPTEEFADNSIESSNNELKDIEGSKPDSKLEVSSLSFSYDEQKVLENISFSIRKNEKLAIVGPSGSGKSTLLLLLDKFYAPDEGKICLDGVDSEKFSLEQWRSRFAYLQQEVILLGKSVRDNLQYGLKEKVSDEKLYEVLNKVKLSDFVKSLDKGLDSIINDGKVTLSGGETQRLGIARLLLKDTQFVLLDEATSNLDALNEARAFEAINELGKNTGLIMVTHKIKLAQKLDKVLLIENGQVKGFDSPDKLLETSPLYKQLYQAEIYERRDQ